MKISSLVVSFEKQDMHFLKQFGLFRATSIVRKHYKKHKTPFIHDTYQLASQLSVSRWRLFSLLRNLKKHYKTIMLKKKSGGFRIINAPDSYLKRVQSNILRHILSYIEVSPYATAYIRGKSLKDNAAPHVNHKYLLKMDVSDFFGSITYAEVLSSVFNSKRFPRQIGAMLTSFCCLDDHLPQGAPTSPAISNIVMKSFDDLIGAWCEKQNVTYTRYCDDLTFSANEPLYNVYVKAKNLLIKWGFEVNENKTKFISRASCQRVTGLTVNEKVSIPRDYKRKLRQDVYYAMKFGLADSVIRTNKTEFIKNGTVDRSAYYNHLQGKMFYVLQIEPENKWFAEATEKLSDLYRYGKR